MPLFCAFYSLSPPQFWDLTFEEYDEMKALMQRQNKDG